MMSGSGLRLRGMDPVFFTFHLLFLLISYGIYLAPHIAPSTFAYLGFLPLVYPIIFVANFLLVLLLLITRWQYGVLFLLLSIGLYFPLTKSYQYFGKESTENSNFKVLTFNAHYFKDNDLASFSNFFNDEDADIILLQELYWRDKLHHKVKELSLQKYYHESHGLIQFFSKYPIIETKRIFTKNKDFVGNAAYADIDVGEDTIRVINVYLESMLLDKSIITNAIENNEISEENSKIVKNKLTRGFLAHEHQIKEILPYIYNSKHPVILAGDLNAVPNSYEYQQLNYYLNDPYPKLGRAEGTTFFDLKFPLRLDYIFHSEQIVPTKYEVKKIKNLSDHYPVVGYFQLP